jgi:hypothetical protein
LAQKIEQPLLGQVSSRVQELWQYAVTVQAEAGDEKRRNVKATAALKIITIFFDMVTSWRKLSLSIERIKTLGPVDPVRPSAGCRIDPGGYRSARAPAAGSAAAVPRFFRNPSKPVEP